MVEITLEQSDGRFIYLTGILNKQTEIVEFKMTTEFLRNFIDLVKTNDVKISSVIGF